MSKQIIFNKEAREKLMSGANKLADAVRVTLGAKGRNVMIGEGMHAAFVTNDGVTVARSVELDDPIENMGAYFLKEAAAKTEDMAGDGTTTATILTQSMLKSGMKYLAADANPMDLKRGMHKALDKLIEIIDKDSKKIAHNDSEVKHVATISANNDDFIGGLIAEAISKVGASGIISVESSTGIETKVEIVEGTEFDRGYISPYFMNNIEKKTADLEEALILVTDNKIFSMRELLPILEKVGKSSKKSPLLIISDEIDSNVVPTIVLNHSQGLINVACVKAPGFGDIRVSMLEDIAAITGATFISSNKGMKLEDTTLEMLGSASRVVVAKDKTSIIGGYGETEEIESRINQIEELLTKEDDSYNIERLKERLSRLVGGAAVLYIGGATETEMEEKKFRVDDALSATKAALSDGIVPGGGVELVLASIKDLNLTLENRDEELGVDIVVSSLKEPMFQILRNAGLPAEGVHEKVCNMNNGSGFDVRRNEFVNMIDKGIIDPAKVTKSALTNAVSISSMILTTEAIISKKPNE